MSFRPYLPHENAVLAPYVRAQVRSWDSVMAMLPGRTIWSAQRRLRLMRFNAGMLWRIPMGGANAGQARCRGKFVSMGAAA